MTLDTLAAASHIPAHQGDAGMATLGEIADLNAAEQAAISAELLRKREAARLKKQRQRERRRQAMEFAAVAEAQRLEREAIDLETRSEELAPAVLRKPILRPDGSMLRGPLVQIEVGKNGALRASHGAALPRFSERQNRAARQLQLDWRDVGTGCGAPAVDYGAARGGGDGDGNVAMLDQISVRLRLEGALAHLGAFTPAIVRVVLDRIPIPIWGQEAGKTAEEATAWIRAALDRLAQFYWPPREEMTDRRGFLTFGPARESYDTTPPDTARTKIIMAEA
jgi:hypothetical protein